MKACALVDRRQRPGDPPRHWVHKRRSTRIEPSCSAALQLSGWVTVDEKINCPNCKRIIELLPAARDFKRRAVEAVRALSGGGS